MIDPLRVNVKVVMFSHKPSVFRRRRDLHALLCDHCGFLRFVPAFSVGMLLMRDHIRGVHGMDASEPVFSDEPFQVTIPRSALGQ